MDMSEHKARERNISLTITLDSETHLYVVSGSIPNPAFGVMLAHVLREEMEFRLRMALGRDEAQRVALVSAPLRRGGLD